MLQVFVPFPSPVPELLPIFGDVWIVQVRKFPSMSWIVIFRIVVVIGTPTDSLFGIGFESVGGLFTGSVCVVNVKDFLVQLIPSVALTYHV